MVWSEAIEKYALMRQGLDRWFASIQEKNGAQMRCRRGCARCCYGLFAISLPDAVLMSNGVRRLPADIFSDMCLKSIGIQERILRIVPRLQPPYFLNSLKEDQIDEIVERIDAVRCPALGDDDECLVYPFRPMACRLEGLPMVDARDGPDWCELNFTAGIALESAEQFKLDYGVIQEVEREATEELSLEVTGKRRPDLRLFVPSVFTSILRLDE